MRHGPSATHPLAHGVAGFGVGAFCELSAGCSELWSIGGGDGAVQCIVAQDTSCSLRVCGVKLEDERERHEMEPKLVILAGTCDNTDMRLAAHRQEQVPGGSSVDNSFDYEEEGRSRNVHRVEFHV